MLGLQLYSLSITYKTTSAIYMDWGEPTWLRYHNLDYLVRGPIGTKYSCLHNLVSDWVRVQCTCSVLNVVMITQLSGRHRNVSVAQVLYIENLITSDVRAAIRVLRNWNLTKCPSDANTRREVPEPLGEKLVWSSEDSIWVELSQNLSRLRSGRSFVTSNDRVMSFLSQIVR